VANTMPIRRLAMLSVHTCPLAAPGGYKTGGMNVYVAALSRALAGRGIAVDIFTRDQVSCAPHRHLPFDPQLPNLLVRVIHLPAGPLTTVAPESLVPDLPAFAAEVIAFAVRESVRYDAIYSHYWLSGLVAQELNTRWHLPTLQMFHTLGIMKDRIAQQPIGTPRDFAEAAIMAQADRLIAATPAEREQLIALYGAPETSIAIVPPGVDLTRFHPYELGTEQNSRLIARQLLAWPLDRKVLLFVGRIEPLKALDTLIESLAAAFEQAPGLRESTALIVVGGDPREAEVIAMRALAASLGVGDSVEFHGSQPHDRMPLLYRAADALVIPSDYESFGMSALEAMACGTPVIAMQVGGLAYLINGIETVDKAETASTPAANGLFVPPRDRAALAAAIVRLLSDSALRDQLGAHAAQEAIGYGWSSIAVRILAVLLDAQSA